MYLPSTAWLTLAKDNVVHDPVLGMFVSGNPIEQRGHIEPGVDTRMLQLIHKKSQWSNAASTLDAGGQAFEFAACAAR